MAEDDLPDAPWSVAPQDDLPDAPWLTTPPALRPTGRERQRSYLESLREGPIEQPAGQAAPGPDLSDERRTLEQNLADWGEVGKGTAKAIPATIAGGMLGDVEGLGRAGINLLGSNPLVPFSVDPETEIPTTEEGGYLGPRGLGIMEASTTSMERAGSMIGSIVGPGLALKGAKTLVGAVKPVVAETVAATKRTISPQPSMAPAFPEELPFAIKPEAPVGVVRPETGARLLPPETPHRIYEDYRAEGPTRAGVGAEGHFGPLMDIRPEAINHLRTVMREEGWTPHTLEARLEEMSPHQFLGELSPNTESRLGGIATYPGQSRTEIVNTLQARKAETKDRLRSSFNRAFGEPIDVAQETRINRIDQQRAASPLYREYESMRIHPTAAVQALMPRLRGLEGVARQLARVEGVPFDQTFFVGGPNKVWPTARSWDQIKQAIDLKIDGSYNARGQATKWTRAYTQLKNDLLAALEAPEQGRVGEVYRAARRAFAEPASIDTAIRMGERLLNASIRADELPFLTAAYSEAEMNALRQGLRAHLEDKLGRPGVVERRTINEVLGPNNERKIRWVIGDEATDDLLRSVRHEADMWDSPQRIYQGSPTSGREATRAEYGPKASWIDDLSIGQVVGAVMHPVETAMTAGAKAAGKKHVSKSAAKKEAAAARYREDLAKLMTLQGPERDAVLRWLFDTMDQAPGRFRGGRIDRNRGGLARLANAKSMKAKRLHGTPFKQWTDAVGKADGGSVYEPLKLTVRPSDIGVAADPEEELSPGLGTPPPVSEDPFERAALRTKRGVMADRGAVSAPEDTSGLLEAPPDWMLEPMLEQQQKGEYVPEGRSPDELAVDEFGRLIDKQSFEPIKMIERPGMLPLVGTPKGLEFAMPKVLDVAGYLGGGWGAAGKSPMLGSGIPLERKVLERGRSGRPIRTERFSTAGDQAILEAGAEKTLRANPAPQFFSALERAVDKAKLNKATPDQWLGYLRNQPGVKAEEPEWVKPFEGAQGHLTKQQLQAAIAERKVRLEESLRSSDPKVIDPEDFFYSLSDREQDRVYDNFVEFMGGITATRAEYPTGVERRQAAARWWADMENVGIGPVAGSTKYGDYQLPGGTNYRELLLRMPSARESAYYKDLKKEADALVGKRDPVSETRRDEIYKEYDKLRAGEFTSSHWDEPNVLAHVRMNDRVIGEPTPAQIEEIGERIAKAVGATPKSVGSGAPAVAVKRGMVTRQEAADWSRAKGMNSGFQNEPGVGLRSLHLEEIQSDWHQKGRKSGYRGGNSEAIRQSLLEEEQRLINEYRMILDNIPQVKSMDELPGYSLRQDPSGGFMVDSVDFGPGFVWGSTKEEAAARAVQHMNSRQVKERRAAAKIEPIEKKISEVRGQLSELSDGVPDAPFKSTWPDLALKRMIREAAEKNYDAISWTPGKAQAERYPETLRQAVSEIDWHAAPEGGRLDPPGRKLVSAVPRKGGDPLQFLIDENGIIIEASAYQAKGKEIEELFGKDMAKRIMSEGEGNIEAKDFVIGGHGMEAFYDQMLVNKANALGKKYGARVEIKEISQPKISRGGFSVNSETEEVLKSKEAPARVLVMKLTPAMKRAALREGYPLFSGAPLPTGVTEERQETERGRKLGGRVGPTEAQKAAGNYKKDHVTIHGLNIAIENRAGSQRTGTDKGGKKWSVRMPAHYGYIKGTEGSDEDHVDCYIGPNPASPKVFIINQLDVATGKFDEHKCMLGFANRKQAENTYQRGFSDGKGKQRLGHVTEAGIDEFKSWLNNGNTKLPVKRSGE